MATDQRGPGTDRHRSIRVVFRCQGCGVDFLDDPAGPGRCPRCGAIGGHERLGRPRGRDP